MKHYIYNEVDNIGWYSPRKTYRTETLLTLLVLLLTVAIFAGEHFGLTDRLIALLAK